MARWKDRKNRHTQLDTTLNVIRGENSALGNPGQHSRADLLALMEREYEINPLLAFQHPM